MSEQSEAVTAKAGETTEAGAGSESELHDLLCPYPLCTDYNELFELISKGARVAAFVDYSFRGSDYVYRDVVCVRRDGEYRITIGVRGHGYGGLYPFDEEDGGERELFIQDCKRMNLGWVKPGA